MKCMLVVWLPAFGLVEVVVVGDRLQTWKQIVFATLHAAGKPVSVRPSQLGTRIGAVLASTTSVASTAEASTTSVASAMASAPASTAASVAVSTATSLPLSTTTS